MESLAQRWPDKESFPPPTEAVLCIRSMMPPDTSKPFFAQPPEYEATLKDTFGDGLKIEYDTNPNNTPGSLIISLGRTIGSVLLVVEATNRQQARGDTNCITVFDESLKRCKEVAGYTDRVFPVLILDPTWSHAGQGRESLDGTRELIKCAQARNIHMVETDVEHTKLRFADFLARFWPQT